jgi:hypothetical protein
MVKYIGVGNHVMPSTFNLFAMTKGKSGIIYLDTLAPFMIQPASVLQNCRRIHWIQRF